MLDDNLLNFVHTLLHESESKLATSIQELLTLLHGDQEYTNGQAIENNIKEPETEEKENNTDNNNDGMEDGYSNNPIFLSPEEEQRDYNATEDECRAIISSKHQYY